jgi:hypothetical protein
MKEAIKSLTIIFKHCKFNILACCCGHGKYPMSIVYEIPRIGVFELFSGKLIPRKKKFYKKDKDGYYYIPETLK